MQFNVAKSLLAICVSGILVAGVTVAASPVWQVGEVTARSAQTSIFMKQFRETVHRSVSRLATEEVKGGPFLVSAALTELDIKNGEVGLRATAVIETVVRDRGRGTLISVTRGRATAIAAGGNMVDAQNSAVKAAVESALEGLPCALRQ